MHCIAQFDASPDFIHASGSALHSQADWDVSRDKAYHCVAQLGVYFFFASGLLQRLSERTPALAAQLAMLDARLAHFGAPHRQDFEFLGVCGPRSCNRHEALQLGWHYLLRWVFRISRDVPVPPAPEGPSGASILQALKTPAEVEDVTFLLSRRTTLPAHLADVPDRLRGQVLAAALLTNGKGGGRNYEGLGQPRLELQGRRQWREFRPRGAAVVRGRVRVGVFIQRWYKRRKFELAFGVALRAAMASALHALLPYFEVHLVTRYQLQVDRMAAVLRRVVPESVYSEVHVISHVNPFSSANLCQQGTYMTGLHKAVSVGHARNLTHMLNLDDDILFEPGALAALLASASRLHARSECAVLSPLISTGVPSVELFAKAVLSHTEDARLRGCFARATLPDGYGMTKANWSVLNPMPDPWDEDVFFDKLARLPYDEMCQYSPERPLNSACDNLCAHPVRLDDACMSLASRLAIGALLRGPLEARAAQRPDAPSIDVPQPAFPYFCNSVWLMRLDDYERIISSDELFVDAIDENAMARWVHRAGRHICLVRGAFALHPAYSSNEEMPTLEWQSFAAMMAHLQAHYPNSYKAVPVDEVYQLDRHINWALEAKLQRPETYLQYARISSAQVPSLLHDRAHALQFAAR